MNLESGTSNRQYWNRTYFKMGLVLGLTIGIFVGYLIVTISDFLW